MSRYLDQPLRSTSEVKREVVINLIKAQQARIAAMLAKGEL